MDHAVFAPLLTGAFDRTDWPHPAPTLAQQRTLCAGIRAAWRRLRAYCDVRALDEDQTTQLLYEMLHAVLKDDEVEGFYDEVVFIAPDPKVAAYDAGAPAAPGGKGKRGHAELMPDLSFALAWRHAGRRPTDYAVQAECKPVPASKKLKPYYGPDGMERFVDGRYAKDARFGMMIAYADPGYSFETKMRAPILKSVRLGRPRISAVGVKPPTSVHDRSWTDAKAGAPGEIKLLHLWLSRG